MSIDQKILKAEKTARQAVILDLAVRLFNTNPNIKCPYLKKIHDKWAISWNYYDRWGGVCGGNSVVLPELFQSYKTEEGIYHELLHLIHQKELEMTPKTAKELREDSNLYATYCSKYILTAQNHGAAVATDLFISMLNPKLRGEGFKWDKLSDLVCRMAEATVYLSFSSGVFKKYQPLIEEDVVKSAKLKVKYLLEHSGVIEWMEL